METREKTSKIREIKETFSSVAEIMRRLGTAGMPESFGKIMSTALIAKEIMEILRTPEMVKNIENFRVISDNINDASTKVQETIKHLEETGVINEVQGLVKSTKTTMDSFGSTGQDLHEVSMSVKEVMTSIRTLVNELRTITI